MTSAKLRSVRRKYRMPNHRNNRVTAAASPSVPRSSGVMPRRIDQRNPSMIRVHGIQRRWKSPLCRNRGTGEGNWRHEQAELNGERHDVTEVAILHVERGQKKAGAEGQRECESGQRHQQQHTPVGQKPIPNEQDCHQTDRHREIDEARDHGARRDEQAREIHLRDQTGVSNQARGCFGEGQREKLPRQYGREDEDRIGGPPEACFVMRRKATNTSMVRAGRSTAQATPMTVCL
jgi:hypothetical protein